jgi:hypothetical protein
MDTMPSQHRRSKKRAVPPSRSWLGIGLSRRRAPWIDEGENDHGNACLQQGKTEGASRWIVGICGASMRGVRRSRKDVSRTKEDHRATRSLSYARLVGLESFTQECAVALGDRT